ncbi:hypothetical protein M422DRAFT_25810 [Sphaerobolus stellatus SS14]|nr:hypothetical protein M422DRAFT_25810 [Sphaerobolus stellatus SS14]
MQHAILDKESSLRSNSRLYAVSDASLPSPTLGQPASTELPYLRDSMSSNGSVRLAGRARIGSETSSETSKSSVSSREIVQYATMLGRKWACPRPGHELCYTGKGAHINLGDEHIMTWVTAMCSNEATVETPPRGIFRPDSEFENPRQPQSQYRLSSLSFSSSDVVPSGLPTPSPTTAHNSPLGLLPSTYLSPNTVHSSPSVYSSPDSPGRGSPAPPPLPLLQRTPVPQNSRKHSSLPQSQSHSQLQSKPPIRALPRTTSLPVVPSQESEPDKANPVPERSVWSPYSTFFPSPSTSSINDSPIEHSDSPPAGSKGKKSKTKAGWLEGTMLVRKGKAYVSKLKKLQKNMRVEIAKPSSSSGGYGRMMMGAEERKDAIRIVADAIEMTRPQYSPRVHKMAYEVAKEIQAWLQLFPSDELLKSHENLKVLLIFQTCMIPILLMRLSAIDPNAATLASSLTTALTKIPLNLNESTEDLVPLFYTPSGSPDTSSQLNGTPPPPPHNTHNPPTQIYIAPAPTSASISSIAIHLVAKELGAEEPTCPGQHSWLGVHLLKIVEMTLKVRKSDSDRADDGNGVRNGAYAHEIGLTRGELDAIWGVGVRRQEQFGKDSSAVTSLSLPTILPTIRPWEVALLALCASPSSSGSLSPFFTLSVLGTTGLPLLITSLNSLLNASNNMDEIKWEDVGILMRVMAFLSEQSWVVSALGKGRHAILTSSLNKSPSLLSIPNSAKSQDDPKAFGADNDREMIRALLLVFRKPIPLRWFSIRFWAMDTIRNMVGHRPGRELVKILLDEEAENALVTLFTAPGAMPMNSGSASTLALSKSKTTTSPRTGGSHTASSLVPDELGSTGSPAPPGSFAPMAPNNPRSGPDSNARTRQRMMDRYRTEAAQRAEELVMYMRIWANVSDDDVEGDAARAVWEGKDVGSMRIKVFKGVGGLDGAI